MPNPLKYIEHGSPYVVTSRTEEGLPFADGRRFRSIVEAIMARAQELYPVDLSAYDLGANHFHMIIVPQDPEDFTRFVGYVKQELAHAVNRIRGRKKKTVWCDGYDSPILLGYSEALYYVAYCYTQAQAAHQADTIEEREENKEGATSWGQFISGSYSRTYKRLYRTDFAQGIDQDEKRREKRSEHTLVLSPYAWLKRVAPTMPEEEAKAEVIRRVRELEQQFRTERQEKGIAIKKHTSPERAESYVPTKRGVRMQCICWDIPKRIQFLRWTKERIEKCRAVLSLWRKGDRTVAWPPGFFPPCFPVTASLLPS